MNEDFLQYIWRYNLFTDRVVYSSQGDRIEIVEIGKQNFDSGPDFFNARIKINEMLWAGNVEIHVDSSAWYQHNHHHDPAYDSVILHVVANPDAEIVTNNKREVPTIQLKFPDELLHSYESLLFSKKWIPCFDEIKKVDQFFVNNWLDRMLFERLERKSNEIFALLEQNQNSWEETFYQILLRYFGMKVNAEPFQQLARSLPMKLFAKQKNSLLQIEAMLFGQSGLLEVVKQKDEYWEKLWQEYQFLKRKYKLEPMKAHQWKWMRLRPANFPTIRIAQLASLIYQSTSLFSKIRSNLDYAFIFDLFQVEPSVYWQNHYQFGVESSDKKKRMGRTTIHTILINTVVPVVFSYVKYHNNQKMIDDVCDLLHQIPAEINQITRKWKEAGVQIKSAFQSQALLQLKDNYCDSYQCLKCEFGNRIIRIANEYPEKNKDISNKTQVEQ
jgi:hypothetical protein